MTAEGWRPDFTALVREHQSMVYSLALHFVRDPSAAEDIAQEVFLRLHRHMAGLKSDSHALFWLRQVTCRHAIDGLRKKSHGELSLDEAREPATAPAVDDPWLSQRLNRLVGSLPENLRMAVVLRYQEDLDPEEIARVLDLPPRTVRDHLQKGMALLRQKASRYLGEV